MHSSTVGFSGGKPVPLIVICGPTCTGKTAAAVEVAERLGGEIIAVDSRTVYRFMDIGTAKPTPAQQARVRHHLLDVVTPDEIFTVARFRRLAGAAIADIEHRGKKALLVGGTGLYIRTITDDLQIPEVPPQWDLRRRLEDAERSEPGLLHRRLMAVDPTAAARIHPRNVRRLIRALEVYEITGASISAQQRRGSAAHDAVRVGLMIDRSVLYDRINARVDDQIAAGLVGEVRRLLALGYTPSLPSMQGLGYKELAEFLEGKVTLKEAVRTLKQSTRRYAKRQATWFRSDQRIRWIDVTDRTPPEVADAIAAVLE